MKKFILIASLALAFVACTTPEPGTTTGTTDSTTSSTTTDTTITRTDTTRQ